MNDGEDTRERAPIEPAEADRPGRDRDDRTGVAPNPELRGSLMAGTAAGDETAASLSAGRAAARRARRTRSFWRELPVLFVIALLIALLIKSFVVQAFYIPSSSMENTLDIGDKVLVNKLVYHFRSIEPGDIVVFNGVGSWDPLPPPGQGSSDPVVRLYEVTLVPLYHSIIGLFGTAPGQQDYIKRVIGVPGDRVACCTASGDVSVNGVPLSEQPYLYPGNLPSTSRFSITVPPGRLWVMGDHRSVSYDSRGHMEDPGGGTVPESMVVGRAFMTVWPPSRWRGAQGSRRGRGRGAGRAVPAAGSRLRHRGPADLAAASAPPSPEAPVTPCQGRCSGFRATRHGVTAG